MFLASPVVRRQSYMGTNPLTGKGKEVERLLSSSPEPLGPPAPQFVSSATRRPSHNLESSGLSGNELASHSDFSDNDIQRLQGASIESLAVQSPQDGIDYHESSPAERRVIDNRNTSQMSGINLEHDPDRVAWQGWLWYLRSKGGVRQWKDSWAVLRPRNLILYKDESEYTAQFIVPLSSIVNVVDIDPVSRTKVHCLQIITEEKSYRFCAHDEEALVQCLGAFKSLLAKRRELEARVAAAAGSNGVTSG
jgi:PH domain